MQRTSTQPRMSPLVEMFDLLTDEATDKTWWPKGWQHDLKSVSLIIAGIRLSGIEVYSASDCREGFEHAMELMHCDIITSGDWSLLALDIEKQLDIDIEAIDAQMKAEALRN